MIPRLRLHPLPAVERTATTASHLSPTLQPDQLGHPYLSPSLMHPGEARQEKDAVNIPEACLLLLVGEVPSHPPCLPPHTHM